ncbi:hypothetical protein D3C71_1330090 [compost metagenome]
MHRRPTSAPRPLPARSTSYWPPARATIPNSCRWPGAAATARTHRRSAGSATGAPATAAARSPPPHRAASSWSRKPAPNVGGIAREPPSRCATPPCVRAGTAMCSRLHPAWKPHWRTATSSPCRVSPMPAASTAPPISTGPPHWASRCGAPATSSAPVSRSRRPMAVPPGPAPSNRAARSPPNCVWAATASVTPIANRATRSKGSRTWRTTRMHD